MQLTVTVKSVNHRYLDLQIRAPTALTEIEPRLRSVIQHRAARGRVELGVTLQLRTTPGVSVELNESLMAALSHAAAAAQREGWVETGLTAGDLLRFPQAVTIKDQPADSAAWQDACEAVVTATDEALLELDQMRRKEGEFLQRDLEERSAALSVLVDGIVAESEGGADALRERLLSRVAELEEQIEGSIRSSLRRRSSAGRHVPISMKRSLVSEAIWTICGSSPRNRHRAAASSTF